MDKTYVAACGIGKFIDKHISSDIYNWEGGGYCADELDKILISFLEDEKLEVNTSFKKGSINKKGRIKYRRIRLVSKNFNMFSKWIFNQKKKQNE